MKKKPVSGVSVTVTPGDTNSGAEFDVSGAEFGIVSALLTVIIGVDFTRCSPRTVLVPRHESVRSRSTPKN